MPAIKSRAEFAIPVTSIYIITKVTIKLYKASFGLFNSALLSFTACTIASIFSWGILEAFFGL